MKRKKSKKCFGSANQQKKIVFRNFEETPNKYMSKIDPINLEEQKLRFLNHGITPQFEFKTDHENIQDISNSIKGQIRFDYLTEATRILEKVQLQFGCGDRYVEEAYGKIIECDKASAVIAQYMWESGTDGMLTVSWSKDLSCSGRMSWYGPCTRYNKPEARKYSLWLKNSPDNAFLREKGIQCLADHEIGTHFLRALNDGLQPWYSDRQRFGLRGLKSQTLLETEEGLAAVNTLLQSNQKLLFSPALTYYTACKATEMSFQELYDHLELYIRDCHLRWKYVMRVKRGLHDTNDVGGYGKDQCYFSGAVKLLRNIDNIDFTLLYSGKVCLDELQRVKRLARLDCLKLPNFVRNMEEYRKQLKHIASVNGLLPSSAKTLAKSKCGNRHNSCKMSRQTTGKGTKSRSCEVNVKKNEVDISQMYEVQLVLSNSEDCDNSISSDDFKSINRTGRDFMPVSNYNCSSFTPTNSPRSVDCMWLPLESRVTEAQLNNARSNKAILQLDHGTNSQMGFDYRKSNLSQSPLQSSLPYNWRSLRTPSPAVCITSTDDYGSPIPYSPAKWLRRRQKVSPNLLPRKQDI